MRLIVFILAAILPHLSTSQKKLIFSDKSYEEEIRTVMLYPRLEGIRDNIRPAVVPIKAQNLLLEFDDLQNQRSNYYAKIIHCNYDWTKSMLMDLDFLTDYNEFPVNEYEMSFNTSFPYVHYYFQVPPVKLPGNYLLVVYRESDEDDLLLSKRFMVFDSQINLVSDQQGIGLGNLRSTNQQLTFKINYSRVDLVNPMESVKTTIRQNQRWDNAQTNITPSFIREDIRELEYRYLNHDHDFKAGNEFRFVDFRSLNFPGQNTGRLDRSKRPFHLSVLTDQARGDQVYSKYLDMNGNYVIENLDNRDAAVSGDYVFVTFTLAAKPLKGDIYLIGSLTNWDRTEDSRMNYVSSQSMYEKTLFLKQGWYDYQYWVQAPDEDAYSLEGSYFQTENLYEVLIYYRPFRPNADLLIGYFQLPVNNR